MHGFDIRSKTRPYTPEGVILTGRTVTFPHCSRKDALEGYSQKKKVVMLCRCGAGYDTNRPA